MPKGRAIFFRWNQRDDRRQQKNREEECPNHTEGDDVTEAVNRWCAAQIQAQEPHGRGRHGCKRDGPKINVDTLNQRLSAVSAQQYSLRVD